MQPQTQLRYRHRDIRTISFHDIHKNEFGGYESSSGDNYNGDNYIKNSKASAEDLDLEDCNVVDCVRQSAKLTTQSFDL